MPQGMGKLGLDYGNSFNMKTRNKLNRTQFNGDYITSEPLTSMSHMPDPEVGWVYA